MTWRLVLPLTELPCSRVVPSSHRGSGPKLEYCEQGISFRSFPWEPTWHHSYQTLSVKAVTSFDCTPGQGEETWIPHLNERCVKEFSGIFLNLMLQLCLVDVYINNLKIPVSSLKSRPYLISHFSSTLRTEQRFYAQMKWTFQYVPYTWLWLPGRALVRMGT